MKICTKCLNTHDKSGKFCSRSCANSRSWTESDKLKKSLSAKKSLKVQTANLKSRKTRSKNIENWQFINCSVCNILFQKLKSSDRKTCSSICSKKIRGGLRKNSGIGKSGWYKGFWLNSTYELAFLIYHLDHNSDIKKCNTFFLYEDPKNKKTRKYYPDFIVNDQIYEIKGFKTEIVDIKAKTCNAKVLYKTDLINIFKYVEEKTNLKINLLYKLYETTK